jgi:drug/metabolite transporter (DMT)-like permease
MDDQGKRRRTYRILAVAFAVAGAVWIVYGFFSPSWILYPLIGVVNLGIAYACKLCGS